MITQAEKAYIAGLIDVAGYMRLRNLPSGTRLPYLFVHHANMTMLEYLGSLTDTTPTVVDRSYSRVGCTEHCPEQHVHIVSTSGRWALTGAKLTIMLHNIAPFMRLQRPLAEELLEVGMGNIWKPQTQRAMRERGWSVPRRG